MAQVLRSREVRPSHCDFYVQGQEVVRCCAVQEETTCLCLHLPCLDHLGGCDAHTCMLYYRALVLVIMSYTYIHVV